MTQPHDRDAMLFGLSRGDVDPFVGDVWGAEPTMELRRLRRHVINRGGLCDVWLVYSEYPAPETHAPVPRPRLVRAFWSRAEAVDWALEQQAARYVPRYEVYHVPLDEKWVTENTLRPATHVSLHSDGPERHAIAVTPGAIAHAFG